MKHLFKIILFTTFTILASCGGSSKAKRGCPANEANLGAERVMAGEGSKKPSKFKVKNMGKGF